MYYHMILKNVSLYLLVPMRLSVFHLNQSGFEYELQNGLTTIICRKPYKKYSRQVPYLNFDLEVEIQIIRL